MDECSAWTARTHFLTKIRQKRRWHSKNSHVFFFSFFLLQVGLFISHFFIPVLTSHYMKLLLLLVMAAQLLAWLFRVTYKIHLHISSGVLFIINPFLWTLSSVIVTKEHRRIKSKHSAVIMVYKLSLCITSTHFHCNK